MSISKLSACLVAATAILVQAAPAQAASASGSYAQWVASGGSGAWQGAGTPAAGFPVASLVSDASSVQIPSGATTFLGPATPMGAEYGSSRAMNYLNISTAAALQPSTTTLTFDEPTPARNWAFALGDIDADTVSITATDANGDPVPVPALGFQGTFNYCAFSPKPGTCKGSGPFTDVPTWVADAASLVGGGLDTSGASGWFQPTAAIKTITFRFATQIGFPSFQLWLASKAIPVETIISGPVGECEPRLELLDADGQPILDATGKPVVAKADEDGHARFAAVADGRYTIRLVTPSCETPQGPIEVPIVVDTSTGTPLVLPAGTFRVHVVLAATGTPTAPIALVGLGLILLGTATRIVIKRR